MASERAMAPDSWLRPRELCEATSHFLDEVWSDERALYPFTTSVVDDRYVSDYRLPWAARYTINTLLGRLQSAPRARVEHELTAFRRRYGPGLGPGDRGLLVVLLADLGVGADDLRSELTRARDSLGVEGAEQLNLQDLSWLLWGALRGAEAGIDDGLVGELRDALRGLEGHSLARHTRSRARNDLVSFGSTVYYLRALHEHARVTGAGDSAARFEEGVRTALAFQGPRGEWPWLLSVSRGVPLDTYPIYSVHQLAMAMLFLLPALGRVEDVDEAIRRSWHWVQGGNELGIEFAQREPFIVYRSLERDERLPKLRRFTRATARSTLRRGNPEALASRTRVNTEWRSYEAGWLLYAWAGRDFDV